MKLHSVFHISFCVFFLFHLNAQQKREILVYIQKYKDISISEMKRTGIPASITMAQGILESGFGKSALTLRSNNHFGIKCHSSWVGKRTYHDDDRQGECFRVYDQAEDSYKNHSDFLVKNNRYKFLFRLSKDDYASWAYGLQEAGYATSKTYASRLINLIERYDLDKMDRGVWKEGHSDLFVSEDELLAGNNTATRGSNAAVRKKHRVMVHPNRVKFVYAKSGDTFAVLSKKYDISIEKLVEYNDFDYSKPIKKGAIVFLQQKRIRGHRELYVARSGDTMHEISQRFAIQMSYLYKRNEMKPGDRLKEGMVLNLRA